MKIAIVGAGLVGSLAALHLAQKGYEVHLYEYREDIRKCELVQGRSINLALSFRGRVALATVGLEEDLLSHGIPMKGRMLHDRQGKTRAIPYDSAGTECIYSVGRKHLNEVLLSAGDKYPNIKTHFNHKFVSSNFEDGTLQFKNTLSSKQIETNADLIIGCDGAYSAVRRLMLNRPGFNLNQTHIEHGYIELCIPPSHGDFAMASNYLHIWPRGVFMMIALPNQDKSWTVTLFMPFHNFESISSPNDLINFFENNFPDAIPLIGKERLINDFIKTKPQTLISIKCSPYHFNSKVLLLGDAAHAMVPFYGQGMNAGFEDCSILSNILNEQEMHIDNALMLFSENRCTNAHAMSDLAMYNYLEMRDLVTKKKFRMRKMLDDFLHKIMPSIWIPLYNSVSFSNMPYKECFENKKWQDKILFNITCIIGIAVLAFGYLCISQIFELNNISIFG